MATSMRDILAFMVENKELFSNALDKDGNIDVSALEATAIRGDALKNIERKGTFSAEVPEATKENPNPQSAREIFCDVLFSLAADVHAGIKESGTSKDRRISVPTPSGTLEVVLKANK